MRAIVMGALAGCALLALPARAVTPGPVTADQAAMMQIEAIQDRTQDRTQDRSADRWQGRHHYLYDDQYQPNTGTVGSAPLDARACADEPVRLRRSDGKSIVRHMKRCR